MPVVALNSVVARSGRSAGLGSVKVVTTGIEMKVVGIREEASVMVELSVAVTIVAAAKVTVVAVIAGIVWVEVTIAVEMILLPWRRKPG